MPTAGHCPVSAPSSLTARHRACSSPQVLILLCISYCYAVVGMETLSEALDYSNSAAWGKYCNPLCPSFQGLLHALLVLFQLLIAANWSPVLEETIAHTGMSSLFEVRPLGNNACCC